MADPLSILGALAATGQLAEQVFRISGLIYELYNNIQQAAKIISHRILAVDRLMSISRLIMSNAALQTETIFAVLETCLVTAQTLKAVLEKMRGNRLRQALLIMAKEKEILGLFGDLEKAKSSLMLCIQEIDSGILDAISKDTKAMKEELMGRKDRTRDRLPNVEGRYYQVPNRRVRNFVGREDILAQIQDIFSVFKPSSQIVVLKAMGGQGKTQIALEVCRKMKDSYSAIFWIDASSENSLMKDYGRIYDKFETTDNILLDAEEKAAYTQKIFCGWPHPWLIIFDNYDDPQGFNNFQEYIPDSSQGRLLITSRHADTLALADEEGRIELTGFHSKDAIELLIKQGAIQGDLYDEDAATTIVQRLGYHPLAIDQASSYIYKRRISLREFLVDYETRQRVILQEVPRMSQYRRRVPQSEQEMPLNVFTACELSLQQLQANDDASHSKSEFLTFLAFFHCSPFYEIVLKAFWDSPLRLARRSEVSDFLEECLQLSAEKWDGRLFLDRLVEFRDLSLIQSFHMNHSGYYLIMHPLIQDWLLLRTDRLKYMQFSIWATTILFGSAKAIDKSLKDGQGVVPFLGRQNMNCKRFLQPAAIKRDEINEWGSANALFCEILMDRQLYEHAGRIVEGALCAIDQTDRHGTLTNVIKLKRHLAEIRRSQCRWDDARALYDQIRGTLGSSDPKGTYTVRELASSLKIKWRKTLLDFDLSEEIYLYDVLNGLSWVLTCQGRLLEAELVMQESFQQMRRIVGQGSSLQSNWLTITEQVTETLRQEEQTLVESVDTAARTTKTLDCGSMTEAIFIEVSPPTLQLLSTQQQPAMAVYQLLEVLLEIKNVEQGQTVIIPEIVYERINPVGSDPRMLKALSLLMEVLTRLGRLNEAREVGRKALVGYMERYTIDHSQTLRTEARLATLIPLPKDNDLFD